MISQTASTALTGSCQCLTAGFMVFTSASCLLLPSAGSLDGPCRNQVPCSSSHRPHVDSTRPKLRALRYPQRENPVLQVRLGFLGLQFAAQREAAPIVGGVHLGIQCLHAL